MQQWQPPPSSHGHWHAPPPPPDRSGLWAVALIGAAVVVAGVVLLAVFVVIGRSHRPPPVESATEVQLDRVVRAYRDNQFAADERYKGRWLKFSATIKSVGTDRDGNAVVRLNDPDGLFGLLAYPRSTDGIGSFRQGQRVRLVCRGAGVDTLQDPAFVDCEIN